MEIGGTGKYYRVTEEGKIETTKKQEQTAEQFFDKISLLSNQQLRKNTTSTVETAFSAVKKGYESKVEGRKFFFSVGKFFGWNKPSEVMRKGEEAEAILQDKGFIEKQSIEQPEKFYYYLNDKGSFAKTKFKLQNTEEILEKAIHNLEAKVDMKAQVKRDFKHYKMPLESVINKYADKAEKNTVRTQITAMLSRQKIINLGKNLKRVAEKYYEQEGSEMNIQSDRFKKIYNPPKTTEEKEEEKAEKQEEERVEQAKQGNQKYSRKADEIRGKYNLSKKEEE